MDNEKFVFTSCIGSGCHEYCTLKTFVKDGRITRTEKTILPGPEEDRFECCQKGMDYGRFQDSPHRLRYPMRRVGERGEGAFERISWDEALDEISQKMARISAEHGPQSILLTCNIAGYPSGNSALFPLMLLRFVHAYDASVSMMTAVDESFFGAQAIDLGDVFAYGMSDPRLMAKAKHIIIWASNPIGNTRAAVTTRAILDAKEQGATITHIGMFFNTTAAKSDRFVPIKRGTDAALALAMAREIVARDAYDSSYLTTCTVAPLLVRQDTGKFLRSEEAGLDCEGAYVAVVAGEAIPVFPHTHEDIDADLHADLTVNGISCTTAFRKLEEHLDEWTMEKQEAITGVPVDVALAMVDEYLAASPSLIYLEEAMRYKNSVQSYRAVQLLAYLTGQIGVEGGGLTIMGMGQGHPTGLNDLEVTFPEGLENCKGAYVYPEDVFDEAEKDEPAYKAYFNMMGNPVHSNPGRKDVWDKLLKKMELVVVSDVFMSDTALYADYLLPDTCTFERYELLPQANHIILQEPAVEPPEEVMTGSDVISELGKRLGLGHLFDKTCEEWLQVRLQSRDVGFTNLEQPITWDRLKKEKAIRLALPESLFDPMATIDFRTASGRIEFYSEDYVEVDAPMAKLMPTCIDEMSPAEAEKYPLHLFVGRPRVMMQTQPFNVMDDLIELNGKEPWMYLNPKDAAERGIKDGDEVEVYNARGNAVLTARLSESCPPGVANMWLCYRASEYKEGGPTYMMRTVGARETMDDFGYRWREVQLQKRGLAPGERPSIQAAMQGRMPETLNFDRSFAGNYDVIWDNSCNVRKA